jgi:O-antigen/teichoic acid export membrane protein
MSLAQKALRGSFYITIGEVVSQLSSLLRNIILARVLTKADFGIAAILGMTISIFEIGGRLSIEHCIIQSKEGDQPLFMAVAHSLQAMLGIVSGVLIFLFARPMATYFDVPEAAWALQLLAIVPILRALTHMDVYRMTRELHFLPGVLIDIVPQLAITLAVWPLTRIWKSYVVLVWLLVGKQAVSTLSSHLVAKRPYRWAYDREAIYSILTFGWPLLINGLLLFGIMQGDRFVVGIKFSVAELGVYAVAGSLAVLPAGPLFRMGGSILLPLMSAARDDVILFNRRLATSSEILALFSATYAGVMIVAGKPLVAMLFGAKYSDAGALTALLGLGQALRLLRNLPTIAAMSKGDTINLMYSNMFRLSGLALAFPLAMAGASLTVIAGCASIGEGVALFGSFWRFSRMHRIPAASYLPAFSLAVAYIALCAILAWQGVPNLPAWFSLGLSALLMAGFTALHLALFADSRRLLLTKLAPMIPFLARNSS